MIKVRDAKKHRPRFANNLLAVMSVLYEHAIDLGWINSNPVKGVQKLKIPSNRQRPYIPWTDEACALFRKEARHEAVLAFEMGIGSIQRPSDLVKFSCGDYNGFAFDVTQGKTHKRLWLPCSNRLKSILDSELYLLGGRPHPSSKILQGIRGGSLSDSGMAQTLGKERKRLGLLAYDLHAMRYRGVMELTWAGCSVDEKMAYSGHDTKDMVAKYAGKARQTMRGKAAWEKRNDADEGKS